MSTPKGGQQIDLASLSVQQLTQVKKQLDDEVQHLSSSYQSLRGAQQKFRECVNTIKTGIQSATENRAILVPLTSSLYVPGKLTDTKNVLVDVGTGFYVEKSTDDAQKFYTSKVEELGKSIKDLETVVNGKANNLRVVEEVLRQKMLASQQAGGAQSSAGPS